MSSSTARAARTLTSLAPDAHGRSPASLPDAGARPARARHALAVALFTVAVAANAALLFAVQPLVSKLDLPLLGGILGSILNAATRPPRR